MSGKGPKEVTWNRVGYPNGPETNHSHGVGERWHTHSGGDEPHAHLHTKEFEDDRSLVLRDEYFDL